MEIYSWVKRGGKKQQNHMLTQNKQSNNNPHARLYAQRLLSLSTPSIGLSFTLSIISFLIAATPWKKTSQTGTTEEGSGVYVWMELKLESEL